MCNSMQPFIATVANEIRVPITVMNQKPKKKRNLLSPPLIMTSHPMILFSFSGLTRTQNVDYCFDTVSLIELGLLHSLQSRIGPVQGQNRKVNIIKHHRFVQLKSYCKVPLPLSLNQDQFYQKYLVGIQWLNLEKTFTFLVAPLGPFMRKKYISLHVLLVPAAGQR